MTDWQSRLAGFDVREEAIRRARRMGDPAAVSAAIAVIRARDEDEARGRELGERLVEAGLLSEAQFGGLLGIPVAPRVERELVAAPAECAALQPEPTAVAVMEVEAPAPVPQRVEPPVQQAPSLEETAHPLGAGVEPVPASPRFSRWPYVAAAAAGVLMALAVWRWVVPGEAAAVPPDPTVAVAKSAPPPSLLPKGFPLPSVPLPPPPAPRRAPAWAPRLRQLRAGDSSAVRDALGRIGDQLRADPCVSIEASQAVSSGHRVRRDRVVAWVELSLSRYAPVAGLRETQTVEVAWAGE